MILEPLALGLPRRQAALVVRIVLEGLQLGEGVNAALKGDLGGGDQVVVLAGQLVLLLHVLHDLRGEGLALDLGVQEQQLAVLRLEVLAEGALQQGLDPLLLHLLDLRAELVPEILFLAVELVPGVDGLADVGQGGGGVGDLVPVLIGQECGLGFLVAPGLLQPLREVLKVLLDLLGIGSLVRHLGKFHVVLLSCCGLLYYQVFASVRSLRVFPQAIGARVRSAHLNCALFFFRKSMSLP